MSDATAVLKQALAASDGLPAVTEIIGNSASFDKRAIADALIQYFSLKGRVLLYERRRMTNKSLSMLLGLQEGWKVTSSGQQIYAFWTS